jgi:hypothetical protein
LPEILLVVLGGALAEDDFGEIARWVGGWLSAEALLIRYERAAAFASSSLSPFSQEPRRRRRPYRGR